MLRQDLIDAVAAGRFNIYPISTIDQGIELLTGFPSGDQDSEGNYPPETINGKVQQRLAKLAEEEKKEKQRENSEQETTVAETKDGKEEE
jgi:hypothetical protein